MTKTGFSIGLVPYFPCGDRFVPGGYRVDTMDLAQKLQTVSKIKDVKAVELSYPADFTDPIEMKRMLDDNGLVASNIEIELFGDAKWKYGSLSSRDKALREDAITLSKKGMDVAAEMGCEQISLWLGQDGYDYPMQIDYKAYWDNTVNAVREIGAHNSDIKVTNEYKIKESRTHLQVSTVGKTLMLANETGLDNVGVMIDVGHAFMAYENPAESAVILDRHKKLFHLHFNDNFRYWDDDLIVGSVHLWETLELIYWLEKIEYDGWYSLDIFPYREESSAAVIESIENIKKMMAICETLDDTEIAELHMKNDAAGMIRLLREAVLA